MQHYKAQPVVADSFTGHDAEVLCSPLVSVLPDAVLHQALIDLDMREVSVEMFRRKHREQMALRAGRLAMAALRERQGVTGDRPATVHAGEAHCDRPGIGVDSRLTATEALVRDAGERPAPVSTYERTTNRVDLVALRCRCICKPGVEPRNLECVCHGDPDPDYGLHDRQTFGRTASQ